MLITLKIGIQKRSILENDFRIHWHGRVRDMIVGNTVYSAENSHITKG